MRGAALVLAAAVATAGCRPALDDRPWLVTKAQILAVRAEPPEVAVGRDVVMEAVALDPTFAADVSSTAWTLCRTPKPLGENRVVAEACLAPAAADAAGNPVTLTIPTDACQQFGPSTPQPPPGAPPTRPRDPDATGGYFQPVTAVLADATAIALERVACGLPDASLAIAQAYQAAYRPNLNPTIAALTLVADGAPVDTGAVPRGARITVTVSWPAATAETFPVFDRTGNTLVDTQEILTASWYVTGGALDRAAAEISDPSVLSTSTAWTAPEEAGPVDLLVVLRDSRGGAAWSRATFTVE
ncbi:MAG TPA: hypothetical protein VIF57_04440 [Polyangia bacterium]